jgi:hypothetical protein
MNLSLHFAINEFTRSDVAARLGIDNDLPIELFSAAKNTAEMMERIRTFLTDCAGKAVPVLVSSGYRCLKLNRAIGSQDTSDHVRMMAIDFTAPAFGTPLDACRALVPAMEKLGIGQLIYEHTWVHVSSRTPDKIINRVLTVQRNGYAPGLLEGGA